MDETVLPCIQETFADQVGLYTNFEGILTGNRDKSKRVKSTQLHLTRACH